MKAMRFLICTPFSPLTALRFTKTCNTNQHPGCGAPSVYISPFLWPCWQVGDTFTGLRKEGNNPVSDADLAITS